MATYPLYTSPSTILAISKQQSSIHLHPSKLVHLSTHFHPNHHDPPPPNPHRLRCRARNRQRTFSLPSPLYYTPTNPPPVAHRLILLYPCRNIPHNPPGPQHHPPHHFRRPIRLCSQSFRQSRHFACRSSRLGLYSRSAQGARQPDGGRRCRSHILQRRAHKAQQCPRSTYRRD